MKNNILLYNDYFELILKDKQFNQYVFIFDIDCLDIINQYKWYLHKDNANKYIYPFTNVNNKSIYIKDILFNNVFNITLKFKDNNKLDYRKNNIYFKYRNGNKYETIGDITKLYTNNNEEIIIDTEDLKYIKNYTWFTEYRGYIMGRVGDKVVYLHRFIMSKYINIDNYVIDHKNHKKNNNKKHNLRVCTISENEFNSSLSSNNTSGYTGVYYNDKDDMWCANIQANHKRIHLGSFTTLQEAVEIRKEYEDKLFGEYAYKNSIVENIC